VSNQSTSTGDLNPLSSDGWHREFANGGIKMFDRLIESDSQKAEFKGRSRYFVVSTIIVGVLFLAAVVFSLYAADIDIGTGQIDVSQLIAPVDMSRPEPPEPVARTPQSATAATDRVIRQANVPRVDEPQKVPTGVSVTPNTMRERPRGAFAIGKFDFDPPGSSSGPSGNTGDRTTGLPGGNIGGAKGDERKASPPPVTKAEVKPPPVKTLGVVNGRAVSLPPPPYPPPAKIIGAEGLVNVQVTIDESGRVISSKAVSGHVLLRQAAENAAFRARFTPTLLSNQPVKVTGVIVYNFKRN
jgi:periplasmic protein TonB